MAEMMNEWICGNLGAAIALAVAVGGVLGALTAIVNGRRK